MKRIPWLLALFVLFLIYFIFFIRTDIIDNLGLHKELDRTAVKLAGAEQLHADLTARLKRLGGSELVEELARTRLCMIKKGEVAYKVIH